MYRLQVQPKTDALSAFMASGLVGAKSGDQFSVLAGGAIRSFVDGTEPNDFDVFMVGDGSLKAELVARCDAEFTNTFRCPQEFLFTYDTPFGKTQIIAPRIYDSVNDILDSFDLTACRAAYDGTYLHTDKDFIRSVKKKTTRLHRLTYPTATMNRIFKYRTYGYNTFQATEDFIRAMQEQSFTESDAFRHYID